MKVISIIVVLLLPMLLSGQYSVPEMGKAFDDTEVPRVDISIDPNDFNKILGDIENDTEYQAQFVYTTSYSADTVDNVGLRLRGNTSRDKVKKSFKVSFNSFIRGQKWEGLEKLNLNGEANDPSLVRSKLAWDIFRSMKVPASRSNHVELYVNGEYRGLYLNVEHIDEEFVSKRFNNDAGNLYKCLWPADMNYKGNDPENYKEEFWGRQAYELKTNLLRDDYTDLAHLIDVLNNYNNAELLCELENILDVDGLLRCIAVDVLIGNWDGAFLNKNNFYLYSNPVDGLITFIPYDLDNTFGIDWFDEDWATTSLYNWSNISGESRPLYKTILSVPEYKNRLSHYFSELLNDFLSEEVINTYLDNKLMLIKDFREDDSFADKDFDFSFSDFLQSYESGVGGHVPYGLREYISRRRQYAIDNIIMTDLVPAVNAFGYTRLGDTVSFDINIVGDSLVNEMKFYWQFDSEPISSRVIVLDDGKSSFSLFAETDADLLTYYVSIDYGVGVLRHYPFCKNGQIPLRLEDESDLVINEFVASNLTGKTDEVGEYDDWIELFNNGGQTINLSDYYLTDDRQEPNKWRFPERFTYPVQYSTFWLDKDSEQGEDHANFKLSKSGEYIGLYKISSGGFFPVDTLNFEQQESDWSSARIPNGSGDFAITESITYGSNNDQPSSVLDLEDVTVVVYPNPTNAYLTVQSDRGQVTHIEIFDSSGSLLKVFNDQSLMNPISDLSAGIYFLKLIINDKVVWHSFVKN